MGPIFLDEYDSNGVLRHDQMASMAGSLFRCDGAKTL
jgi:hypothetical protein